MECVYHALNFLLLFHHRLAAPNSGDWSRAIFHHLTILRIQACLDVFKVERPLRQNLPELIYL